MKRHLFFAALAAVGFASCSDSDVAVNNGNHENLVEIKLGMGSIASVVSRGTGTVGSMIDEKNVWNNEQIHVIMTNIVDEANPAENWGFSLFNNANIDPIFNGTVTYPTEIEGAGLTIEGVNHKSYVLSYWRAPYNNYVKYYPMNGRSDFFGYHLGGAQTAAVVGKAVLADALPGSNLCLTPAEGGKAAYMSTLVTIDGSNDLMAGKAITGDVMTAVTVDDPENEGNTMTVDVREGFTAKLARNENKQPVIDMKHLLTRLTFSIVENAPNAKDKDGNELTTDDGNGNLVTYMNTKGGSVDLITVNTLNQAELKVAYNDVAVTDVKELLVWQNDEKDETTGKYLDAVPVTLMDSLAWDFTNDRYFATLVDENNERRELNKTATVEFTGFGGEKKIGGALFVKPYEESYDMNITFTIPAEKFNGAGDRISGQGVETTVPLTIKAPADTFKPGYSYHVVITVHGLSEVTVSAVLEPWKDGGNISLDVEDAQ